MPVEIRILNVTSTVHNVNNLHEQALDQALSFRVNGSQFSPLVRKGLWDGKKHLYKFATVKAPFGKFSTGLFSRVFATLQYNFPGEQFDVFDDRKRPNQQHPLLLPGFELHDYEQEAVNIAVDKTRGLFRLPTGAGKSVVQAGILARLNLPTMVISHRTEIAEHLKRVAEKALGFEVSLIQGPNRQVKHFNIAMIQTLMSCFDNRAINKESYEVVDFIQNKCQVLMVDECHHSAAASYSFLSNRALNAYFRLGFSATISFGKPEDMLVEACFGKVQMSITPSDLVRQKRLSKPYIFFVDYGDTSSDKAVVDTCFDCGSTRLKAIKRGIGKTKKLDNEDDNSEIDLELSRTVYQCLDCNKEWTTYSDAMIRNLVKNVKRNEAIVRLIERQIKKKRSTLVLVTYIEHGQELSNMLAQRVDPKLFQFVYSGTGERKDLLDQLQRKEKLCLIATSVYGEGIDIPSLSTLINARASASVIDTLQVAGRALRRSAGKWKTLIIDFQDKSKYFKARSKFRYELLKAEPEFKVTKYKLPQSV